MVLKIGKSLLHQTIFYIFMTIVNSNIIENELIKIKFTYQLSKNGRGIMNK